MNELNEQMFDMVSNDLKNRTINDYLLKDEKILWHAKPNVRSYAISQVLALTPFALLWLFIDSTVIVSIVSFIEHITIGIILFLIFFFAVHLVPVWIWIGKYLKSKRELKYTEYYITNKRVLISNLPNDVQVKEINIKDIRNVELSRRGLDRLVRVGDVSISTGKKGLMLYDIKEPYKIYSIFESVKNKYSNLENLPTVKICAYCGRKLFNVETKCDSCGAVYKMDKVDKS